MFVCPSEVLQVRHELLRVTAKLVTEKVFYSIDIVNFVNFSLSHMLSQNKLVFVYPFQVFTRMT